MICDGLRCSQKPKIGEMVHFIAPCGRAFTGSRYLTGPTELCKRTLFDLSFHFIVMCLILVMPTGQNGPPGSNGE